MNVFGWSIMLYLFVLLGIGYVASKRVKGQEDFMVAGRSATKLLMLATFVGTISSGSTWIGSTGFYYKYGWSQIWQGPGTVLPGIIILLFIGPYLRRFAQFTLPDFFASRYNSKLIRSISAITILCLYFTILVAMLMSGARLLESALEWDYKLALLLMSTIVIVYSWAGGQTSVIWCDTFQFFVIITSCAAALYYCLNAVGGIGGLNASLAAIDSALVRGDGGGTTPWTMALAWTLMWGLGNPAQPYTIGRFYCAKDVKTAVFSAGMGAFVISLMWMVVGVVGLTARVKFPNLPSIDLAYPTVATKLFPLPIGILAVCGIFAAILSTLDTLLVTIGTTVGRDIYQQTLRPEADSQKVLQISRIATAVVGIGGVAFAMNPPGTVLVITSFAWSVLASAFFVPLVAGIHWRGATKLGAMASMVGGGAVALTWFYLGKPLGLHPVIPGLFSSCTLMLIVSTITRKEDITELWNILHPSIK